MNPTFSATAVCSLSSQCGERQRKGNDGPATLRRQYFLLRGYTFSWPSRILRSKNQRWFVKASRFFLCRSRHVCPSKFSRLLISQMSTHFLKRLSFKKVFIFLKWSSSTSEQCLVKNAHCTDLHFELSRFMFVELLIVLFVISCLLVS